MNDITVEREIDGVVYKARYKGIAYSIALSDRLAHENASFQLAEILFKEILISPKVEIDDFDDMRTFSNVFSFLLSVANGYGIKKKLSNSKLKRRAEDNWSLWRLIFESDGALNFQAVFGKPFMTPQDAIEANFALDKLIKARKEAAKRKR